MEFWLQDMLELSRNHYGRIVHFSFGLLIVWPFREWLECVTGVRPARACFLAVVMVLAFSGFYESMEGVVAMIGSPELGMANLGTQCDQWNAQCDSFLAFAGSVLAMVIALRIAR